MAASLLAASLRALLCIALIAPALAACGAAGGAIRVSSPFSARDAELFDDAVDYLADPSGLQGAWAESWGKDVDERAKAADVIAVVRFGTIVSDVDLEQHEGVRLVPELSRSIKGTLPEDARLYVSEGRPGYVSVDANRSQLMAEQYVLLLKWYESPDKTVAAHWHVSPASEHVIARVEEALGRGTPTTSRVVIHKD